MIDVNDLIGKITCADCMDILKQLPDKCIDLVLTDPPYNASNSTITNNKPVGHSAYNSVNEDWDKGFIAADFLDCVYDKVKQNGSILVFCSYHTLNQYLSWNKMKLQQIIHWHKTDSFPAIAKVYTPSIEYCCWFVKGSPYTFNKKNAGFDLILSAKCNPKERIGHPTQKPTQLFQKLLSIHSNENDLVLDCFSGSGTTAIACHRLKRRFICIEKDHDYWEASCKRLEEEQKQGVLF